MFSSIEVLKGTKELTYRTSTSSNLPDGDGRCRMLLIPGDGARLGGVALPRPESVSVYRYTILSWSVLEPAFYKKKKKHINAYIFISQP